MTRFHRPIDSQMFILVIFLVTFSIVSAGDLHAQKEIETNEFEGEIVTVLRDAFRFKTTEGKLLIASVDPARIDPRGEIFQGLPEPQVLVTGEETPRFLKRGMSLRFLAEIEKDGKIHKEIPEITVFNHNRKTRFGLSPVGAERADGDKKPEPETPPVEDARLERFQTGRMVVTGQLRTYRRGELMVKVRGRVIRAPLANDAKIKVWFDHQRFARRGDAIHVKGVKGNPPFLYATVVKVIRQANHDAPPHKNREGDRPGLREIGKSKPVDPLAVDDPKTAVADKKESPDAQPKKTPTKVRPGKLLKIN